MANNPQYTVIRAQNTAALAVKMDAVLADGVWKCAGGPFFDGERNEWCQAVTRTGVAEQKPGEVPLREPRRRAV